MTKRKRIVISAINLFEGGTLSILLDFIDELKKSSEDLIIILVHKKSLIPEKLPRNFILLQYPLSRRSYYIRLFYEYFYFYFLSKRLKADTWFSLHDTSPYVKAGKQFVYFHNLIIFRRTQLKDLWFSPSVFIQSLLYKFVYRINLKANRKIFVQQHWAKHRFADEVPADLSKIEVVLPTSIFSPETSPTFSVNRDKLFFFPSLPRVYKNFETICKATALLNQRGCSNFSVKITLNGSENKYSRKIYDTYKNVKHIDFIGVIPRTEVYKIYEICDCLIFPSYLESWGLPLSEFRTFNKPILAANEEYARESIGDFELVSFFDAHSYVKLANLMQEVLSNTIKYDGNLYPFHNEHFIHGWKELIEVISED